jgi:hypothetical protein
MTLKSLFTPLLALLATALLGACAPTANEVRPDKALDLSSQGAVALSFTSVGIPYLHGLYLFYTPAAGGEEVGMAAYGTDSPGYWSDYYQDVEKGRLAVLQLAPGDYRFTRWSANAGGLGGTRSIDPEDPFNIPFTVEAGKILYLGNLHLTSHDVSKVTSSYASTRHQLSVRDRRDVDLDALKRRLPSNGAAPVVVRLMTLSGGQSRGEHSTYEPYIEEKYKK